MSIMRKRNADHKSYIPNNARDNQYILAEFTITDELIQQFSKSPYQASVQQENFYSFYQALAKILFDLSDLFEVENCQFIANDKIARVRFGQEMHQWQTNQQILFYYNPENHHLQKTFFDANKRAKKISLLFLTSGTKIRENSALFHTKISQLVRAYANEISLDESEIRLRDHQHITYDLFAQSKPNNIDNSLTTRAHKLRPISQRYAGQDVELPKYHSAMTYAIVNIPISNRLLNMVDIDPTSSDPYNPLYTYLTDTFTQASMQFNLNNGALIANGLVPIVRYSIHDIVSRIGELQMLGYNPEQNPCGIVSKWDASELVDNVQLIFVATDKNKTEHGFARFLNQIEKALKLMATGLKMEPNKDEVVIRFHQHIAYNF
ncbi:DUF3083 family protein [Colwellia sp. 1_MG-2023]|uniref:DUF3083 family protein n=1 Tax=unclassified Colwellia TaxID=196834 RepID=UPI001C08B9B4|nr:MULTISPECIES: DUF3083 family protein [unclassified Colwellia]MBU2925399.1 DUF3083 family protein [Colwellia sp. C2M11]MDO6489481.1 DUF3083 family protein [Colwellia sp. 6_MG-2023]MDO6653471.1 DUF3083 family protein [Colwellia sp. 3_MG-2023]MDO6666271.1 DUF3083 family protein [Colwellia sp. 2_MG-2023]MDO6690628.1 DUF3083 family protein [Colwellia sp. 1_MG-2023]